MKKPSNYSVYSKDVKRRTKHNPLSDEFLYSKLPKKKFDIIYLDPPWDYGGKLQYDKSKYYVSGAKLNYSTIPLESLKNLPINRISSDDSLLFLWVTGTHMAQGIRLAEGWAYSYRTIAFVWNKMRLVPGHYTLSGCELCLVFKKGKIPQPRGARNVHQYIESLRGEHSVKPEAVRKGIEKMFPKQKKIELFATKRYKGWTSWGLNLIIDQKN